MRKKLAASVLSLFLSLFSTQQLQAAYHDIPACYRDLEVNFFVPEIVGKALSLHGIYQSEWGLIIENLQRRSREVPQIIDARASRMSPDPLSRPIRVKEAKSLLLEVLYEIFEDALHERDFTVQDDIREMFNYIRRQQSIRLKTCFGEEDKIKG